MTTLNIYLFGCILTAICYYIFTVWEQKTMETQHKLNYKSVSPKLTIYRMIKYSLFSWLGVIYYMALFMTYLACRISDIDDWIENKLD